MATDFLSYRHRDGVTLGHPGRPGHPSQPGHQPTRFGFGIRHVMAVYLFCALGLVQLVRAGTQLAVLAMGSGAGALPAVRWSYMQQAALSSAWWAGGAWPAWWCGGGRGGKPAVLLALVLCGALCLAMPLVVDKGGWIAASNSVLLMGAAQSMSLAAARGLADNWIPPQERDALGGFVYSGLAVGSAAAGPVGASLCGGAVGWRLAWFLWGAALASAAAVWAALTTSRPEAHPAAPDSERDYIRESIAAHTIPSDMEWRRLVRERWFWGVSWSHISSEVLHAQLLFAVPTFLNQYHHMSLQDVGWWSLGGWVCLGAVLGALLPRHLRLYRRSVLADLFDLVYYRKLLNTIGSAGVSLGLVVAALSPEGSARLAASGAGLACAASAFRYCGFYEFPSDVCPSHGGSALQLSGWLAGIAGGLVPVLDALLLDLHLEPAISWRVIFLATAAVCAACDVLFLVYATPQATRHTPHAGHHFTALATEEIGVPMREDKPEGVH